MNDTPNLVLPYILAAQSQKHVTHNEAIRALDALVQITALDRNLTAPPAIPVEGDRYIVAASPTGSWAGQAGKIAAFQDAAWLFYAPKEGWIAWVADENIAVVFDGATWTPLTTGGVTAHSALTGLGNDDHTQYHNNARGDARYTPLNPATLGVNATADATNKLAVASSAVLLNNAGAGIQVKVNKAAVTDTASFLFQTAFSGRAEIGLTGDDDFHFKVSPNGTAFNEAIVINKTTGACTFPNTTLGGGSGTVTNVATGTGLTGGPITTTGTVSLASMAANTLKGNATGATAAPADLTAAQAKTLLAITPADVSGLGALATASNVNLSTQATGTLQAAQEPAHTGDVTNTAGSLALTIAANAVTNAKAAQMVANTFKANNTGATANAADITPAQAKALLAIAASDVSGLAAVATSGSATDLGAGTLPAARAPALTGDVTAAVNMTVTTISANAVTNVKAADVPTASIKGRISAATGDPEDLTPAQAKTVLAIAASDVSGLALIATSGSATDLGAGTLPAARAPALTGDVTAAVNTTVTTIAANAVTNAKAAQMAANTFKANNTGATANAADITPAQAKTLLAITTADFSGTTTAAQEPAHTGDVTNTAGSLASTIATNAVTNAKAAQMAAHTFKGNNTAATANALDLTIAQLTAELNVVASATKGLAPASGGGTVNFLRADGVFAAPPGASEGEANTASNVGTAGVGVFKQKAGLDLEFKKLNAGSAALTLTDDTANSKVDIAIAANGVTNALLAQMAANTIKGNITGATANASDLTGAQVQALLTAQPTMQTFTSTGTWTKPTGCKRARVRCIGGGGGAGGSTGSATFLTSGGSGGAGGYSESILDVTGISTAAITIGAGGSAASNTAGGAGGNTSFAASVVANGGAGGSLGTSGSFGAGGAGGAAGTGTIAIPGSGGSWGPYNSGAAGFVPAGAAGASSVLGGAPATAAASGGTAANGTAAVGKGCGGGGGVSNFVATNSSGGAGAAGIVIVEEFY